MFIFYETAKYFVIFSAKVKYHKALRWQLQYENVPNIQLKEMYSDHSDSVQCVY